MRTLLYVPMMHRMVEIGLGQPMTPEAQKAQLAVDKIVFGHWNWVNYRIRRFLTAKSDRAFHFFCEGWIRMSEIDFYRTNCQKLLSSAAPGVYDFSARMILRGGTPHVTEHRWLHRLAYNVNVACGWLENLIAIVRPSWEGAICNSGLVNFFMIDLRDRYIARRMSRIVKDGEVAVLPMGGYHDVPKYLDGSWRVIVLTTAEYAQYTDAPDRQRKWLEIYRSQNFTAPA